LLPEDWLTWSESECRAVLAHELAHIQRGDYTSMFVAQFITAFYWYHPLVRWLIRQLRCGQELAADALAVRCVGSSRDYLRTLCRLALHQEGAGLPAPARMLLTPEIPLTRRIAMLRDGTRGQEKKWVWWRRW